MSLERLELKKLPDMVAFKYQNVLYDELRNFHNLRLVELELDALILTNNFYESVSELTQLNEIKLNLNKFDMDLFKTWTTSGLSKVTFVSIN